MKCPKCGNKTWFDVVRCKKCGWTYPEWSGPAPTANLRRKRPATTFWSFAAGRFPVRRLLIWAAVLALFGPAIGHEGDLFWGTFFVQLIPGFFAVFPLFQIIYLVYVAIVFAALSFVVGVYRSLAPSGVFVRDSEGGKLVCPSHECPDFQVSGRPGEYREGILKCPKCGTRLVADPPIECSTDQTRAAGKEE